MRSSACHYVSLVPFHDPACELPPRLKLWESEELSRREELGLEKLADCALCPRNCHVNRLEDAIKVCKTGRYAVVSSHFAHSGEERCLSGSRGSGAIFFSSCNLRCVFCQNYEISWHGEGRVTKPDELMQWIIRELGPDTYVNVMAQYHPACRIGETEYPEINRCITGREFEQALDDFRSAGLVRLDSKQIPIEAQWL